MKLVIKIPEEEYEVRKRMTAKGEHLSMVNVAIANGKPLDSVLDEIDSEIEKLDGMYVLRDRVFYAEKNPKDAWFWYVRLKEVIDIFDMYRAEGSEKE